MDKDEYREEVIKELREQNIFLRKIKESIDTIGVITILIFLALLVIMGMAIAK